MVDNSKMVLLKAHKDGDASALTLILNQERTTLFDYIVRMSGGILEAHKITDAVITRVKDAKETYETYEEFLATLFGKARILGSDVWGAETDDLREDFSELNISEAVKNELIAAGKKVMELKGATREVAILMFKIGFDANQTAKIMGIDTNSVKEYQECVKLEMGRDYLHHIPNLPDHQVSSTQDETRDISSLVADVRQRGIMRENLHFWFKITVIVLLMMVSVVIMINPSLIMGLFE